MFYDLTQAYDRVQWATLAWAMQRLHIPNAFIRLVLSLLTNTRIRTQTAHGLSTESIKLEKGVPQGTHPLRHSDRRTPRTLDRDDSRIQCQHDK